MISNLDKIKIEEVRKNVLLKASAFSRKPNMTFEEMIKFMLKDNKRSLSCELIDYFNDIGKIEKTISKQAYSEQRQNISYTIFEYLNTEFVKSYYED